MIGERIRRLREENHILLRHLAAHLDIDTALLSKMERGDRFFRKEEITALAAFFNQSEEELISLWLADKLFDIVKNEPAGLKSIELVQALILKNTEDKNIAH